MNIAIGSDALGIELKREVLKKLRADGHTAFDMGVSENESTDYPDIANTVAAEILAGRADRGILICGTGIGMAITANKIKGIYAAVCHDIYSTERSILSNNANILCMGALVIGKSIALTLLDKWLSLQFVEGPSSRKISRIKDIEKAQ